MNFSGFPLYSSIYKEVDNDIITIQEKQYVMNNIKKIEKQNYEYIYALIISYYIDEHRQNLSSIPYEGKQLKTGIKFNLEDFPNKLQKIIYIFIKKCVTKQKEEIPVKKIKNKSKI
jgi:hypothetical protein